MFKVLILCHNKTPIENHWYYPIFSQLVPENSVYETIDILPGGTYQDDCFSEEFINRHIGYYDIIISPDSGGPWYTFQINRDYDQFSDLLEKISTMLKYECIILFDKFIYSEFKELTIEKMSNLEFKEGYLDAELFGKKWKSHLIFYRK